uniref:Glucose-1-phosphate adenylyltransferase/Bifunctional protein GlmU-like C-terminal hexapeptide domain-containing protein n=1 Tax=Glycine max TaxID=3847 RepID=A0A0R0LMR7_SOYBN
MTMTMAVTVRRVLAFASSSSAPFFNLNQNANLRYILPSPRHLSAFSEDGSVADKFHKWHNGGGTLHESASIDSTALVEVGAVVHSESIVGPNVRIGSGTIVGPSVTIAHSTNIGYNVALSNCCIGDSCVIHNGVCIGQDGFGFYVDGDGNMIKKPQMLNVIIGNNVEIGANTCIDRGSWRDTVIGDNSKIDNLVQHRRLCDYGRKGSNTRSCIHHIKGSACCSKLCNQGHQRTWGLWWLSSYFNSPMAETSCQ